MLKFKISRFRTNPANRELCTTKSDGLGEKASLGLCENGLGGREDRFHQVPTLFFHQIGQIWSYRALVKAPESSRRDLAIEKGFRASFCF